MFYIKSLTGHIVAFVETKNLADSIVAIAQRKYFGGNIPGNQIPVYTVHQVETIKDDSDETVNKMVNGMCCPNYRRYD